MRSVVHTGERTEDFLRAQRLIRNNVTSELATMRPEPERPSRLVLEPCIGLLPTTDFRTSTQKGNFYPKRITSGCRVTHGHTIFRINSPEPKRVSVVPTTLKPHAL